MFRILEAGFTLAITLAVLHYFAPQVFDLTVSIVVDVLTLLQQLVHTAVNSATNTNTITAL